MIRSPLVPVLALASALALAACGGGGGPAPSGDIRNAPFGNVGADGNPTAGGWSAYAYGLDGARPTGVYGGFQADFADGAAIGQFDAR